MATAIFAVFLACLPACSDDDSPAAPQVDATSGLMARYAFAGDVKDATGNGNDGALLGGATANGFLAVGSNGTDALSLPASLVDGLGDFTIAGWVRMDEFHIWPSQWVSGATVAEDNNFGIWYSPANDHWAMCLFGTARYWHSSSSRSLAAVTVT